MPPSSSTTASATSCFRVLVLRPLVLHASGSKQLSLNNIYLCLRVWFVTTTISAASSSPSVISVPPPLHLLLPSS
ncbi:hypothetical protein F2Q68_00011796 [Brassica cretica]|uniref:Uncharacterized protein n=1 Tax=Brassica cretica TaxID=69181 RepID=A0A8S9KZ63_BRACR|nr:hypothetical protein F2Q68_00011796 [Brassica cretica]